MTDRYLLTAPDPGGAHKFYRIVRFQSTADDSDGDGLSDDFETNTLGTNPLLHDSDKDGFGDGFEFVAGFDAKDATDFPTTLTLPRVSFVHTRQRFTEGDGTVSVPITIDDGSAPFNGEVKVTATDLGEIKAGIDYTLAETATLSNGTGNASLSLIDDSIIKQKLRVLALEIVTEPGVYLAGGGFQTSIVIGENDSYWTGVLREGLCETNFRLRSLQQGSSTQVDFVAGAGNDGLVLPADGGGTDQSTGIIPVGIHPATVAAFSETAVDILSRPMVFSLPSSLFGDGLQVERILHLRAGNGIANSLINTLSIAGPFSESLRDPSGTNPHLTVSKQGVFILVRDVLTPPNFELFSSSTP